MQIFLSWSGDRSLKVAKELGEWMPKVIQAIEPWLSADDINKGGRWLKELSDNLEKCNFGIVCLTPENLLEPWLLFESGALSKAVKESHVCTLLFNFDQSLIEGPLSQFQTTKLEKDDMLKLMKTINRNLGEKEISLSEGILGEIFSKWWPELEDKLKVIPDPDSETPTERPEIEIMKETLEIVRSLDRQSRTAFMPASNVIWGQSHLAPLGALSRASLGSGELITVTTGKPEMPGLAPEGNAQTEDIFVDVKGVGSEDPETK